MTAESVAASEDNFQGIHSYRWSPSGRQPERIVLLVHGLMMSGRSFSDVARHLSLQGALVVAPDLRGFGRWYHVPESEREPIDYERSFEDLAALLEKNHREHPEVPIYVIGESLGAHLARRLASVFPEELSGAVLSSPCQRPRVMSIPLLPHAVSQLLSLGANHDREVDLAPFAREFLKNEPDNLEHYLNDPLARKSLDVLELFDSIRIVGCMDHDVIPDNVPVLILSGRKDCVCNSDSIEKFVRQTKAKRLHNVSCEGCGHLILQSARTSRQVIELLLRWMADPSKFN